MTSIKVLPKELINLIIEDYNKCEINIDDMYEGKYINCMYIKLHFNINVKTINSNINIFFLMEDIVGFNNVIGVCKRIMGNDFSKNITSNSFDYISYINGIMVIKNTDNCYRLKCNKEAYIKFINELHDKIILFFQDEESDND